jgi:hypothetical protein
MALKKKKAAPVEEEVVPQESKKASFTTQEYSVMKQLNASGIFAINTFGSPMTFEYASEDIPRIVAVLGDIK